MSSSDSRLSVLSLYRAVLRAATYLPDSRARAHVYRLARHRIQCTTNFTTSRRKNAEQMIRTLQYAIRGDPISLKYVLSHTYGTTGPRRRQLLDELRALSSHESEPVQEAVTLSTTAKVAHSRAKRTIFQTFLESQIRSVPEEALRNRQRRTVPTIPATNIWGRPMPQVRVRNIQHQFWKDTYEKMLPPLASVDWDHLRQLATGAVELESIPRRRARVLCENATFNLELYGLKPIRSVNRFGKHEDHKLTSRYLRRIYAVIWNNTSKLEPSSGEPSWSRDKVRVTWGRGRSFISKKMYSDARPEDMELFEAIKANTE